MLKNARYPLILLAILTAFWELLGYASPSYRLLFPPPSCFLVRFAEQFPGFLMHSLATLEEMLAGIAVATLCAFPLAWIMARFTWARLSIQPLLVLLQCLPMFTLAPLMVLSFGWSFASIVIPTALMIFFPLTLNIYQGIRATPTAYLDYFACHHASLWQVFWKLRLPFALPHIFAGLRVSTAVAGVGAIAGEWAGAQKGLGVLLLECRRNMDLEGVFAALLCLMLISVSVYGCAVCLETYVQRKQRHVLA